MKIHWMIFILAMALSLSAAAETGKRASSHSEAAGKQLYQQFCQSCHKAGGVGERPIPPLLRHPDYITAMPLNESSHAWHHSDEQLVGLILDGVPRTKRMPAWRGVLSAEQAQQIIAHIKTFWSDRILDCQGPKHMSCM